MTGTWSSGGRSVGDSQVPGSSAVGSTLCANLEKLIRPNNEMKRAPKWKGHYIAMMSREGNGKQGHGQQRQKTTCVRVKEVRPAYMSASI